MPSLEMQIGADALTLSCKEICINIQQISTLYRCSKF